jgi:hypothetical protein
VPFPNLVDPVVGTVITAAWEIANPLAAVRWLRQLMGNADPPGSSYVVVSSSTTSAAWSKVPPDALQAGAAVANLGYTPVNKAGDTNVGALSLVGDLALPANTLTARALVAGAGGVAVGAGGIANAGPYAGGSTASGVPAVLGLSVGTSGVNAAGPVSAASYGGGTTVTGTPAVLGLSVGSSGIASAGPLTASSLAASGGVTCATVAPSSSYGGGSKTAGVPSVLGLVVGTSGIASDGPIAIGGQQVYHPGNPPPSGAVVPTGAIVAFDTAAHLTAAGAGWTRHTAADGRFLVGAGTSFSQTFTEGTAYGAAWSHTHADAGHAHGAAGLGISGHTGSAVGGTTGTASGSPPPTVATDTHTHDATANGGTLDVTGATDPAAAAIGATTWLPPSLGVVWGRKV